MINAQQNNPITPDSLCDIVHVDDVRVSPDGTRAAFVRTSIDKGGNSYNRTIWLQDLTNPRTQAEPLTGSTKDSVPRWSPDGTRLAFISGRGDKPALLVLSLRGGEAHTIATHPNGVAGFEWSPDGTRVAYSASMRSDECAAEDEANEKARVKAASERASDIPNAEGSEAKDAWLVKRDKDQKQHDEELRLDPRVIDRFPYRTGTSFTEDRFTHIYVIDVPASFAEPDSTKPDRITPSDTRASFSGLSWSLDGNFIYSTYTRDPDSGELFRFADIVRLRVPSSTQPEAARQKASVQKSKGEAFERLTVAGYTCFDALPSPDGKWLAFNRAFDNPDRYEPSTLTIMALRPSGQPGKSGQAPKPELIDITAPHDRSLGSYRWRRDGQALYFTLHDRGTTTLYRADINPRTRARRAAHASVQVEHVTHAAHEIDSFDLASGPRVVFSASTPADPSALYVIDTRRIRALYTPNTAFLDKHQVGQVEVVRFNHDGRALQGWLLRPVDFDPRKPYPLIVQMHGGPHVMWGAATRSLWHESQAMASAGYCVFWCNPRGSDGYGREFWHSNQSDWGDGPMSDVLAGVDLVAGRDYIDAGRLCLTGGSYAGFLTAWIIGKDQRFAAACAQRGVYNLVSMRNTTDIPFFNDRESGGMTPWDDVETLWRMSPISLVPNIKTPLLIEHSEQDFRVPIEQAEQLFQALKLMKKPVQLVRWPREGHELSRAGEPKHRVERIRRIIEWFNEHTRTTRGK